jgi:hypothetical protein
MMDDKGVASVTASLIKANVLFRCAMASASCTDCGGVSPAEGWEECEEECMLMESELMSIGACGIGKLRTIVSPGRSIISWPPDLGSLLCISPAFTCPEIDMRMVTVPVVLDLVAGTLTVAVSYVPPILPSSALLCSGILGIGSRCCLPIPIDSHWDIAAVGVNLTAHPTCYD